MKECHHIILGCILLSFVKAEDHSSTNIDRDRLGQDYDNQGVIKLRLVFLLCPY
jgi:hypothetical protein